MRLIFMGTPAFSVGALKVLIESGHDVVAVYTRPPKARDRGHQIQKSPVHMCADEYNISVYTPKTLRNEDEQSLFASHNADLAVVVAYGLILPAAVLAAPRWGCVNLHASVLPRWRGAAPIQRAIMAGDVETGITLMQMDEGLDTGAMLAKSIVPILPTTTASVLHDLLADSGAELLRISLDGLLHGRLMAIKQSDEGVVYADKLQKEEGLLDYNQSAAHLGARVRALTPWPGTWVMFGDTVIKVLSATPIDDTLFPPGTFFATKEYPLCLACKIGALRLDLVQRAGGKPLDADAFLRGFSAFVDALKLY